MMKLPLFTDAQTRAKIGWNVERCPHILVTGSTGSGKSFLIASIMGRVALHTDGMVWLCDPKNDDFRYCDGAPRYYGFDACTEGLESFYSAFESRRRGDDPSRSLLLLVFDEWAAYLNLLDKKQADAQKAKLATLLMLGRSFHVHVLVGVQRADAQHFSTARDQFSIVIALGNISKEAAHMFGFPLDEMEPVSGVGAGHMLINGADLRRVQVPVVNNVNKLHDAVRLAVSR